MLRYVVKRVGLAALTVFIIIAITFFTMNAIPGGPFSLEKAPSEAVKAVLEARFNLDKSVPEQYILYLGNILQGDFGVSIKTGRDIALTITESFAISARLGGMAVVVALTVGLVMGSLAALTRNKLPDRLIIFFLPCPQQFQVLCWRRCFSLSFPFSLDGFRSGVRNPQTIFFQLLPFHSIPWPISQGLPKAACWMP